MDKLVVVEIVMVLNLKILDLHIAKKMDAKKDFITWKESA